MDVLVIGAGPAGASAAWAAARSGAGRVLLVERCRWPRTKVCGSCVNPVALGALDRMGVARELTAGRDRLSRVRIRSGRWDATVNVDAGVAIERSALDGAIVHAAQRAGADFVPGASARVTDRTPDGWSVLVSDEPVRARVVVACDGLSGAALEDVSDEYGLQPRITRSSWMGAGCVVPSGDAPPWHDGVAPDEIAMHVHDRGYVGLVRLDDDRVDVAAALDAASVKQAGGPAPLIADILESCGVQSARDHVNHLRFSGAGLLTRTRPRCAAPGLLIAGDAAGYVEPFTGEGIAWALSQGEHAGALAAAAACNEHAWSRLEREWTIWLARTIEPRRRACRVVRWLAHRPTLRRAAVATLASSGGARSLASGLVRRLMHTPRPAIDAAFSHGEPACAP